MNKKPNVGDIVFSLNVGNSARNKEQTLTKCEVVSVGRKYFTITPVNDSWKWQEKFYIDGWGQVTDYSADHCLYSSEQEFADEKEAGVLAGKIRAKFGSYGACSVGLDAMRRIISVLDDTKPVDSNPPIEHFVSEAVRLHSFAHPDGQRYINAVDLVMMVSDMKIEKES